MSAPPKVSVIIAAYEAARFVRDAVTSALGQTLEDIEVIVVDDASRDDTIGAAKDAAGGDPRLTCIRLDANGGPSAARNAALAAAKGDWIAVLDADDAMEPQRLETLTAYAHSCDADIVADCLLVVGEGREPALLRPRGLDSPVTLAEYVRDNSFRARSGTSGYLKPVVRRGLLAENAITYDEGLRIAEDFTLIADALAHGARYVLFDQPLYRYTVHAGSISHRLSVEKLDAMIASSDAFAARHADRLDEETEHAVAERRAGLADWRAFQSFVEALKARRVVPALAALAARPSAIPLLRGPIMARLRGRRGERDLAA